MTTFDDQDPHWLRLLAAAQAHADPAVLARARARLGAAPEIPRGLAWLGSPAALVAACALFVVATGASLALVHDDSVVTRDTLVSALIDDDGSYGLPPAGTVGTAEGAGANGTDSGEVTR